MKKPVLIAMVSIVCALVVFAGMRKSAPQRRLRGELIVKDSFTVNAGAFVSYPIPYLAGIPIQVNGHFEATGGRNDIEIYILDSDGLTNFKNGHSAQTYYNSGRVTVAKIHVDLSPNSEHYYLVFSNTFSTITPKAVNGSAVAVHWESQ